MKSSILAVIDGSSLNSVVCWLAQSLAKITQSDLKVQATIDEQLLLRISGYDGSGGLTGSGVFLQAQQSMLESMTELYESILTSFCSRAEGELNSKVEQYIDIGDLVDCIQLRAGFEDLVVVGVKTATREQLERVCQHLNCPVLVVGPQGCEEFLLPEDLRVHPILDKLQKLITCEEVLTSSPEGRDTYWKNLFADAA